MKKALLSLLLSAIIASPLLSQSNVIDANGKRQGYWVLSAQFLKLGSPWLPNQTVEEGNYTNSMKTGLWIEYYSNGNKKSELTYVNNRPNGPAKKYFESGQLMEEGNWVGTRWTGPYKLYYENGNLRQSWNYNSLGQRDGQQLYYHPNGKVAIDMTSKAGKEEGWAKEYNTNGELIKETYHTNGVIDNSKTREYEPKKPVDPNAAIAPEDKQQGTAPTVPNGSGNDVNIGDFDGEGFEILYKNGQVTMKGTFHNRKLIDGEERIYNEAGKLIRIKLYKEGKYVGDGPLPVEEKAK